VYTLSSNTNSITEQAELAAASATAGEALLSAVRRRLLYTYSSSREKVSERDVTVVAAVGAHCKRSGQTTYLCVVLQWVLQWVLQRVWWCVK